jgi:hypothetical protein
MHAPNDLGKFALSVNMKFLLSTAQAILVVDLDGRLMLSQVTPLETGAGLYFGITRGRDRFYIVSRNLELGTAVTKRKDLPSNAITEWTLDNFSLVARWTHPRFVDLHQIRFRDDRLYALTADLPHLVVIDLWSRNLIAEYDLTRNMPRDLERNTFVNPNNPTDFYHFNSLFLKSDKLFVLAHNWSNLPSFALELAFDRGFAVDSLYRDLGLSSHDLFAHEGSLYVLDGLGGRLIVRGARHADVALPGAPNAPRFPRGMAVSDKILFVASGLQSAERAGRLNSETFLTAINRETLEIVADVQIGQFGNSFDLTMLDHTDWTDRSDRLDNTQPAFPG